MTNELAIRILTGDVLGTSEQTQEAVKIAVEALLRLSAQPEQRWIPCSERLPEEKQDVLLAFAHNMVVGFWEDILNDGGVAWYANSGNGWMTGTETVDDDGFPLAWMPLPEPYKGGQDGSNKD